MQKRASCSTEAQEPLKQDLVPGMQAWVLETPEQRKESSSCNRLLRRSHINWKLMGYWVTWRHWINAGAHRVQEQETLKGIGGHKKNKQYRRELRIIVEMLVGTGRVQLLARSRVA